MSRFTSLFNILRCVTVVGALLLAACAPQAEVQLKGEINDEDLTKASISTPESETETPEAEVTPDDEETPEPGDDQEISKVELVGVVSRISATAWVIDGQTIPVNAKTEIEAGIAVGDSVKVEAVAQADGSLLALEVKLAGEDQVVDEVDDDQGEDKNVADDQGEDVNDDQSHDSVGDDSGHSSDDGGGSSGGSDDSGSHDSGGGSDDSGGHGGGDD